MILEINPDSHVPPYEQIRAQIATMAASGVLPEEARLPAIRQLAKDLHLALGTVARAYRELEQQGVIRTRGRHGTFVEPVERNGLDRARLDQEARGFAIAALQAGATRKQSLDAVECALESLD